MIQKNKILNILPHQYPFIFIDKIVECNEKDYIKTLKNVSLNDHFLQGHFNQYPVFPGVFILESMAQSAYILVKSSNQSDKQTNNSIFPIVKINDTVFKQFIYPGDQIYISTTLKVYKHKFFIFESIAVVNSKIVAQSCISLLNKQ
ncbi:3-hydroxyacyl-[acyl-carrier-protein] dehydratase FabZ [Buchnera aphidicola (Thelaxes suberi)]|uniref:3-hydroxyacyl-ACP dehydratase FabZ n=1 Tax=Buchnera aphidicola TaxID=9 RepID=UPI0034641459